MRFYVENTRFPIHIHYLISLNSANKCFLIKHRNGGNGKLLTAVVTFLGVITSGCSHAFALLYGEQQYNLHVLSERWTIKEGVRQ